MIKMRICMVFLLLLELGISAGRGVAQEHASPADLVVLHGKIYTVNAKQPWAEALAIRGGKIIAVGSDKQMESYRGASTQVIDAKGHLVLPGFVDTHVHFTGGSFSLQHVKLDDAESIPEIQKRVKEYAAAHPGTSFVEGFGWMYPVFGKEALPDKKYLDEVLPDRPVLLTAYDGHTSWANSKALQIAGITKDTPDPLNGIVVKDPKTHEPTGALKETYDPLGNLLTVNQKGSTPGDSTQWRTRTFNYDSLSRLLAAYNPESGTTSYTYNDDGTVATKTTPKQNQGTPSVTVTITFGYDEIHRVTSKTYSDGTTSAVKFIYDGVSLAGCTPTGLTDSNPKPNRTSMCDAGGASAWSHDTMGRILSDQRTNSGVTKTASYAYNLNGSLATLTYPSGRMITYSYNNAARPTSAVDVANSINYATSASYTPPGALASLQNGSSLVSTMHFNKRLQPCRISVKSSGTAPASCTDTTNGNVLDFTYNFNLGASDNGNVIKVTNNRDTTRSINYSYDSLNRIATAYTDGSLWGETLQIDAWGNLNKILAYTGKPQPENLNQSAGANNRFTGMSYDAAGNLLSDGLHSFVYDAENHIVTGAGVTYTYDGDGRRVKKSNGTLYWYGTGSDPLDETDLAGATTNSTFKEYVFFGDKRIARRDSTNVVNYYFADHLGTARVVANSSGGLLDDSDFYPYGGERVVTSSSGNRYKFTGKERDTETGLDAFGARYYGSTLGRFTSADPKAASAHIVSPQSWNRYTYSQNNSLKYIDSDGMDIKLATGLSPLDQNRIIHNLAASYRKESGRATINQLSKSDITYTYKTGTLKTETTQQNGHPVLVEQYGVTEPHVRVSTDGNGNITGVVRGQTSVDVTFDFNKRDAAQMKAATGERSQAPDSEQHVNDHELGHQIDVDRDPLKEHNQTNEQAEKNAEDFANSLEKEKNSMSQKDAENEVRALLEKKDKPQ